MLCDAHLLRLPTQPAGINTINPSLHARLRLIEDFDLEIPAVTVSAHPELKLLKNPGTVVKIKIVALRSPLKSTAD